MPVVSPTISISVAVPPKYSLSIGVTPESGYTGDPFPFMGILTMNGNPMTGIVVQLILEGVGKVGEDVTGPNGNYEIVWIADRSGILYFHSEAPGLQASSGQVALQIPPPGAEWMTIAVVGGGLCIIMVLTAIAIDEIRKRGWI